MKFGDVIALAKAGYSVADVKELLAMEQEPKEEPEKEPQEEPEPEEEPAKEPEEEPEEEPAPDYKKLYEEAKAESDRLKKGNIRKQSADDIKSDEDIMMDAILKFL